MHRLLYRVKPFHNSHILYRACKSTISAKMSSEQTTAGTHKDPVTGEMISKTFVVFYCFVFRVLIDLTR